MGKLVSLGITFAENRTVYFPGNMVIGQLFVQLNAPMKNKAVSLRFFGFAYVHWSETYTVGHGENQRTETRYYTGEESFFKQEIVVYGKGSADPQDTLPAGQHSFPFQFQLPSPLPTSYEDSTGAIRYGVRGAISKSKKSDHETIGTFTVLDTLDLNLLPTMTDPVGATKSKTLCCWCCKSDPIELDFHTDRRGYVPGEVIFVSGTVSNGSTSKIKRTSAQLMQQVSYHAVGKSTMSWKCVGSVFGPECRPHDSLSWTNEKILVPPLPPSNCAHCKIIDIDYFVMFECHLRTFAINMKGIAPITIGTVPLTSVQMYTNMGGPAPAPTNIPGVVPSAPPNPIGQPAIQNPLPPSYIPGGPETPVDSKAVNTTYQAAS